MRNFPGWHVVCPICSATRDGKHRDSRGAMFRLSIMFHDPRCNVEWFNMTSLCSTVFVSRAVTRHSLTPRSSKNISFNMNEFLSMSKLNSKATT